MAAMSWIDQIRFDKEGLVPVVAQEATTGELLMLAYANREALEATVSSGRAHYWSRSRGELWRKGDTSGHTQEVVEVRVDCDGDAVLFRVEQLGPACHTQAATCFFRRVEEDGLVESESTATIMSRLEGIVRERAASAEEGSYTGYLLREGLDKILKKVGEESTEVVIAAKNGDLEELRSEVADLLFHLTVLLHERNLPQEAVWKELAGRFGRAPRPRTTRDGGDITT
jgi:phosphoribosyl-AMP cyclohydrolase / phosphoribosyl-ATP pyrophosphohydrolase